jgi:predicted nucleotidyltransferase
MVCLLHSILAPHITKPLVAAIAAFYANDPRILAVAVFGSLGRGTWDRYSDLDLDVVLADGVQLDVIEELRALCASFASLGERALIIEGDGEDADAGDVVLASLMQLSVRYHTLQTTKPQIADSLQVIVGKIDAQTIKAAAQANGPLPHDTWEERMDHTMRRVVEVDVALQRRQLWHALPALHLLREQVLRLFALAHNGIRPYHTFQTMADDQTQALLGATVPAYDLQSVQAAFARLLDLIEHDLDRFTQSKVHLTDAHREVLQRVRQRQAELPLEN